jgi:hypothetical protein
MYILEVNKINKLVNLFYFVIIIIIKMAEFKNTNQSHFKNDECYINQQNQSNKSIFSYITDTSMFVNNNQCFDVTPPFLSYIPVGIPTQNIDIENDLRGAVRNNTKCETCKFKPANLELTTNGMDGMASQEKLNFTPNNREFCKTEFKIVPNGYYTRK